MNLYFYIDKKEPKQFILLPFAIPSYGSAFNLTPLRDLFIANDNALSTSSDFLNVNKAKRDSCSPSILTFNNRQDFLNSTNKFHNNSRNVSSI